MQAYPNRLGCLAAKLLVGETPKFSLRCLTLLERLNEVGKHEADGVA